MPNNIQVGDWVRVGGNAQDTAWAGGHVIQVTDAGLRLKYGSRSTPLDMCLLGTGRVVDPSEVTEIWRKQAERQQGSFTTENGKKISYSELAYVWTQIS